MTTSAVVESSGPADDREQRTIAAALGGDASARRVVMAAVRPAALSYCRARLGVGDRATAIAVEVSRTVEAQLHGRPRSGLQIYALVHAIAVTAVDDAGPARPEASASGMPATLAQLTEPEREVLILRVAVGLTVLETAAALDRSPSAVRLIQHRALERLRQAR